MKFLMFFIDLPIRFLFALISVTFRGWIGWLGIVLVLLKVIGLINWPWWLAALPLEYLVIYCVYMTIDGALYRAGLKDVGRYARGTSDPRLVEAAQDQQIQEIIAAGPERIGATIDALCADPKRRPFAQALLDTALEPYFLLQLAMFANKKVNAHITIKKWRDAGLTLPAEGTPEFFPYEDSQTTAPPEQRRTETAEIPQQELDREVGITNEELLRLFQISSQIHDGINQWLNPPSGVTPKTGMEIVDNLIAQLPKLSSGLKTLHERIQEIWDRAGFDYKIADSKIPDDQVRVKCGDLLKLAKARAQISTELNQWTHPENIIPTEGTDKLGYLLGRMDAFAPALTSMTATLDEIRERNFGETSR